MSTVSYQTLESISELVEQITSSENQLSKLVTELKETTLGNKDKLTAYTSKVKQELVNKLESDKAKKEINDLHNEEQKIITEVANTVSSALDNFFGSNDFTKFVTNTVNNMSGVVTAVTGGQFKDIIKSDKTTNEDKIEITNNSKIYDFTPSTLKPMLAKRIITNLLSQ